MRNAKSANPFFFRGASASILTAFLCAVSRNRRVPLMGYDVSAFLDLYDRESILRRPCAALRKRETQSNGRIAGGDRPHNATHGTREYTDELFWVEYLA